MAPSFFVRAANFFVYLIKIRSKITMITNRRRSKVFAAYYERRPDMKVGLPRAMHFYSYGLLWYTFLEQLGVKVVLSDLTDQTTLEVGTRKMVDTACLPLKILRGHVENLKEKGVDYIFLPRLVKPSEDTYTCPKSAGLPELIFQTGRDLPPLLSPEIDGSMTDPKPYYETGHMLGASKMKTQKAFLYALRRWQLQQSQSRLRQKLTNPGNKTIALIGHPYLIEDSGINFRIKELLKQKGYHTVSSNQMRRLNAQGRIYPKFMFWQSGQDMASLLLSMDKVNKAAGVIMLTAFGCGPDSYIETYLRQYLDRQGIPHLTLSLDEQSGEAGVVTRVEAFLDMIDRRQQKVGA